MCASSSGTCTRSSCARAPRPSCWVRRGTSLGPARWCTRMRARSRPRSQRASRGWLARQPWLPWSCPRLATLPWSACLAAGLVTTPTPRSRSSRQPASLSRRRGRPCLPRRRLRQLPPPLVRPTGAPAGRPCGQNGRRARPALRVRLRVQAQGQVPAPRRSRPPPPQLPLRVRRPHGQSATGGCGGLC